MKKYGLTKQDLMIVRDKIKRQKDFLDKNELITKNGQVKKLIDLSFSANHSYRYYAQLANKVNTMENIALNERLVPLFLTMTLDGFYRDLIKGDYNRFNGYDKQKKEEIRVSVPENEKLGFIRSKMKKNERLTIKDLYNILNYQMRQFRNGVAFKNLYKSGKKYIYIRTVEPHQDGVPHFHMMLFVPKEYINAFRTDFKRFFVAPRNKRKKAFQTDITNASAYIMKYITKSFMDIKNDKELDYIQAWYIKHRIMRCVTSRSVLPQWVYQKCSIFEKDWGYLTDILNSPNNHSEWSREHDSFWIYDTWSDREIEYIHGRLSVYSKGYLVKRAGKVSPKKKTSYKKQYETIPTTWKKKDEKIPIYTDKKLTHYFKDGHIVEYKRHITQYTDYELYQLYENFDIDNDDYMKYLVIRNTLIKRGLLNKKLYSLNNYDWNNFIYLNYFWSVVARAKNKCDAPGVTLQRNK